MVNGIPATRFVIDAVSDTRTGDERGSVNHLVSVLVGAYQPLGELLLLSVCVGTGFRVVGAVL